MTKKIFQVEDCPIFSKYFKDIFSNEEGLELVQSPSKHDFYMTSYYDADLYVLDRHFPDNGGETVKDNWESVASFLGANYPEKPVIILSASPPLRKQCKRHKNIRDVLNKSEVSKEKLLWIVKSHLGVA
jgi:hypothetical protein